VAASSDRDSGDLYLNSSGDLEELIMDPAVDAGSHGIVSRVLARFDALVDDPVVDVRLRLAEVLSALVQVEGERERRGVGCALPPSVTDRLRVCLRRLKGSGAGTVARVASVVDGV